MSEQLKNNDTLVSLREKIDSIDKQLLSFLAQRVNVVRMVGTYKAEHNLPPLDEVRRKAVLEQWVGEAVTLGMSEEFAIDMYALIHAYAIAEEEQS